MTPRRQRNAAPVREYSLAPVLGGVEMLTAVYHAHRFPPHAQETAVLGVADEGRAVVRGADSELLLAPDQVLYIPPGTLHSAETLGDARWSYRAIYLRPAQLAALLPGERVMEPVRAAGPLAIATPRAVEALRAVLEVLSGSAPAQDLGTSLRALLDDVAHAGEAWLHARRREREVAPGLRRVREHLDTHDLRRVTLAELARMAGMSRHHFAHAFSRAYGVPPYAYAMQRRLQRARALIADGAGLSEAAYLGGFADQSHLTRQFLSTVGVTPGEFSRAFSGSRRVSARGA
jgi:AraC-like DNA-binding protein